MGRIVVLAYGVLAYVVFLLTLLYAVGFVTGVSVPGVCQGINDGVVGPEWVAVAVNVLLLGLFGVQHTIMARPGFKKWWTKVVPEAAERSTFVLVASLILDLMFWQWRPLVEVAWDFSGSWWGWLFWGQFALGWLLVLYATFVIDHFDLFGMRQAWFYFREREYVKPTFMVKSIYRYVRHPIMLGFILAFWSAPKMTWGQVLFAVVTTCYILVGVTIEERDLVKALGEDYSRYRARTPMLFPGPPVAAGGGDGEER